MNISEVTTSNWKLAQEALEESLGYRVAHLSGFGNKSKSFSIQLPSATSLELVVDIRKLKVNASVLVYFRCPVNGLPLQSYIIPMSNKVELFRVPLTSDLGELLKDVYKLSKSHTKRIENEHGKYARDSYKAKALWSLSI